MSVTAVLPITIRLSTNFYLKSQYRSTRDRMKTKLFTTTMLYRSIANSSHPLFYMTLVFVGDQKQASLLTPLPRTFHLQ